MMIFRLRLRAALIGAILTGSAGAQDVGVAPEAAVPQYRVEIMIFAYPELDPSEERLDHRPRVLPSPVAIERREPRLLDDFNLESLTDPALPANPDAGREEGFRFRLLRADELQLTEQYRTLQRIPAYRPLLHGGWIQQGLPAEQVRPFDLALLGALNPMGSIRLHLSRFLHLKVDLSYQSNGPRSPATTADLGGRVLDELDLAPRYRMAAERQTRSGELHYFDHPAFGLLVMVTPVPVETTPSLPPGAVPAA